MTDWRTTWLPDLDSDDWIDTIDLESFKRSVDDTELSSIDYNSAKLFHNSDYSARLSMKLRSDIESKKLNLPVVGLVSDETVVRDVSSTESVLIESIFVEVNRRVLEQQQESARPELLAKAYVKFLIDYGYTDPKYEYLTSVHLSDEVKILIEEAYQIKLKYEQENEQYNPNEFMVVCFRTFCGSRYSADKAREEFNKLTEDLWYKE